MGIPIVKFSFWRVDSAAVFVKFLYDILRILLVGFKGNSLPHVLNDVLSVRYFIIRRNVCIFVDTALYGLKIFAGRPLTGHF